MRTVRSTVVFGHPFQLRGMEAPQPAGSYIVDTDEEVLEGMSRLAYRRIAMTMQAPIAGRGMDGFEVIQVDPAELAAALLRDKGFTVVSADA